MDYKKYIGGYVDPEISFDHSSIDNDEIDKRASDMLDYLYESYIDESVKIQDQIGKSEIKDIQTVISSLDDDSFKDFKFIDLVYCDIRYKSKKPIAFLTIRAKMINNSTVGYVSLAVNPKYQNQGIGKSLATKAVSWFKKERGIQFLEWHCLQDNEASRKLANSTGFREYIARNEDEYARFTMESSIYESYIEEYKKDSEYSYSSLSSSKDIADFNRNMQIVFKSKNDMSKEKTHKSMKAIKFNGEIIGYIGFSRYNIDGKKYLGIGNFMIIPRYQSSGHGTKVIKDLIDKYKDTYDEIYCYVEKENKNAIRFYKRIADVNTKNLTKYGYYVTLYRKSSSSTNESYIEEFELPKRPDEQKVSEEILDTVKPIILTSQNKSKASKLGLDLKCEITEVDSGMVFILVLDGPQDKRDTEEARSLLKDLASKCKSKLSDIVSKVDIGDGDEGCLFFTMDKGKIRRKRKDLLESYVEEKFHMMSNPYRKKVIKNLNQYDYIFSKYGSNYKDQRDKEVGNVSGNLSTDKVGNFFVNHFDNDKKGISPGISYWCYKSITSGNLDRLKSDIRSLNREIKSKGIKFDLYGINPNEKIQKYVWVFLYFLDNRRKSLDESYTVEIEESSVEEDVEQEFSPSSFVKRSSLPAKNQKNHTQYLRKKAHSNKTNNATAQSELPKFNQIGELSFEEVAKGVRVKPIFIVTSYTNTPFGKAIKTFTHAQYTHAAISFDTSLEQLYSFNADPKVTTNGNKGGISRESLSEYINTYDKAIIQVNCILCKESDFNIVKNTLDDIFKRESDTRYGYMNILNILIGRAKDTGMSMVCSQFVSYILHKADIKLVDKPDNLVEPKDLSTIVNPRVYKLYEGAAKDYDKKKIDRIFRKLKTKALLIKESLLEYCV